MNNLECNIDGTDTTDYDGELTSAINTLLTSSNQNEKKHYLFHLIKVKMVVIHLMSINTK